MTTQDEAAIRKVIAATTEMFNRHDAKGFGQYYTPDADLVTVRGEVMKGTAEIEAGLNRIFLTRAGGAALREVDASIRFLGSDVALAHVTNELSGLVGPGGDAVVPALQVEPFDPGGRLLVRLALAVAIAARPVSSSASRLTRIRP